MYGVFLAVIVIPMIILFISLVKLFILLSVCLKPWLFFSVDDQVEYFQDLVDLFRSL